MPATTEEKRSKLAELREKLYEEASRYDALRNLSEDKRSGTYDLDLSQSRQAVRDLDVVVSGIDRSLRSDFVQATATGAGPEAGTSSHAARHVRMTPGRLVSEDQEFTDWMKRSKGNGTSPEVRVNFQSHEFRTLLTTAGSDLTPGDGTDAGLFVPRGTPYLPPNAVDRRRLFVADILPHAPTGLNLIPYIREHLPRTNEEGAQTVPEGELKPEVTMQFEPADAPVRKIAAWLPVTTEILTDAPTLRSYIDARLDYMLELREEEQVLNGDGSGTNIKGIRQTSGLQVVDHTGTGSTLSIAGDYAATLAKGFALVENVDGEVDGVAMNPLDYWPMITRRHTGGDGSFDPGISPWGGVPNSLWGIPTVRTRSLPVGAALVGSWRIGAQIFDREETVIRVGDQHADFFIRNKVAILAEERLALAVYRPDLFVECELVAS